MDGARAARLFRDIKTKILVWVYYESLGHVTQNEDELMQSFEYEGIQERVCWLTPGELKKGI